jgi:hypothetical protein
MEFEGLLYGNAHKWNILNSKTRENSQQIADNLSPERWLSPIVVFEVDGCFESSVNSSPDNVKGKGLGHVWHQDADKIRDNGMSAFQTGRK